MLVIAILYFSASVRAQNPLLNLSLEDTTVEAVLNEIRNQTDIDFIFNHEQVEKCPRVSIRVSTGSVEEVLRLCLQNTGLTFE